MEFECKREISNSTNGYLWLWFTFVLCYALRFK